MKDKLITLLGLANEATDEQIVTAATALKTAKDTAETALANEKTLVSAAQTASAGKESEISNLQTQITASAAALANEKKARIELVLDNAIAAGKITAAQRPQWLADLLALSGVEKTANFDAKLVELSNAKPVLNTESQTQGLGERNANAVGNREARIRQDKLLTLVNERMHKNGEDYETAFANIKRSKEGAALLAEMQQPQKK